MPRPTDVAALIAQHKPYAPPLAHKVRIPVPYVPACATNVRATIERVHAQLDAQAARRRRTRRVATLPEQQADMFPSTVVCMAAVQQRRAA
ncbi:hypothetical protein ACQ858_19655 [Variovorax ureilyticus]|uniref:hypothetical protein n=1 Tax=Variovorax ureilyticus TaxID=1836198 RepID=UPI003D67E372